MELFEIVELAIGVLGLPHDQDHDDDEVEAMIVERFGVDIHQFGTVAEALIPFTVPARSPLTGNLYRGFTNGKWWLAKQEVKS